MDFHPTNIIPIRGGERRREKCIPFISSQGGIRGSHLPTFDTIRGILGIGFFLSLPRKRGGGKSPFRETHEHVLLERGNAGKEGNKAPF